MSVKAELERFKRQKEEYQQQIESEMLYYFDALNIPKTHKNISNVARVMLQAVHADIDISVLQATLLATDIKKLYKWIM